MRRLDGPAVGRETCEGTIMKRAAFAIIGTVALQVGIHFYHKGDFGFAITMFACFVFYFVCAFVFIQTEKDDE